MNEIRVGIIGFGFMGKMGAYIQQVMAKIIESARLGQWVQIEAKRG